MAGFDGRVVLARHGVWKGFTTIISSGMGFCIERCSGFNAEFLFVWTRRLA